LLSVGKETRQRGRVGGGGGGGVVAFSFIFVVLLAKRAHSCDNIQVLCADFHFYILSGFGF